MRPIINSKSRKQNSKRMNSIKSTKSSKVQPVSNSQNDIDSNGPPKRMAANARERTRMRILAKAFHV